MTTTKMLNITVNHNVCKEIKEIGEFQFINQSILVSLVPYYQLIDK